MMIYQDISNITKLSPPIRHSEKSKVNITRNGNFAYTLIWSDLSLWGLVCDNKEFVRYTKICIGDPIPTELNICFYGVSHFEERNQTLIAKYVGRYIGVIDNKKWVIDVIFPNVMNSSNKEYLIGRDAIYSNWTYNYADANMRDFVMEKIELIPHEERDIVSILRTLMVEFSATNSENGLIEGKWGGNYTGGFAPSHWKSPSEIFLKWKESKNPVKYGQCWVFAECFTLCMRFLGIPSRTVYAKNSHINPSLDGFVDFFEDETFMKSEDTPINDEESLLKRVSNVREFINQSLGYPDKGDIFEDCEVYSTVDSMWNIHYWNECIISRDGLNYYWEALDSCPYLPSKYEPHSGKSILGPCRVLSIKQNFKNKLYDYEYIHASVNSPLRIWIRETTVLNGEVITIPYVHSIVYPLHPRKSIMTTNKKLEQILSKKVSLFIKNNGSNVDITDNYRMEYDILLKYLIKDNPAIFYINNSEICMASQDDQDEYYVQQVIIDNKNNMSRLRRQTCQLNNVVCLDYTKDDRILSVLMIKRDKYWIQLLSLF